MNIEAINGPNKRSALTRCLLGIIIPLLRRSKSDFRTLILIPGSMNTVVHICCVSQP